MLLIPAEVIAVTLRFRIAEPGTNTSSYQSRAQRGLLVKTDLERSKHKKKKKCLKEIKRASVTERGGILAMPRHRRCQPTGKQDQLDRWSPWRSFNRPPFVSIH